MVLTEEKMDYLQIPKLVCSKCGHDRFLITNKFSILRIHTKFLLMCRKCGFAHRIKAERP